MAVVAEVSRVDDNIFVGGPTRTLTALTSTVVSLPLLTSPFVRWLGGTEIAFISWLPCYTPDQVVQVLALMGIIALCS